MLTVVGPKPYQVNFLLELPDAYGSPQLLEVLDTENKVVVYITKQNLEHIFGQQAAKILATFATLQ